MLKACWICGINRGISIEPIGATAHSQMMMAETSIPRGFSGARVIGRGVEAGNDREVSEPLVHAFLRKSDHVDPMPALR
jgi:hypothetical protein